MYIFIDKFAPNRRGVRNFNFAVQILKSLCFSPTANLY